MLLNCDLMSRGWFKLVGRIGLEVSYPSLIITGSNLVVINRDIIAFDMSQSIFDIDSNIEYVANPSLSHKLKKQEKLLQYIFKYVKKLIKIFCRTIFILLNNLLIPPIHSHQISIPDMRQFMSNNCCDAHFGRY